MIFRKRNTRQEEIRGGKPDEELSYAPLAYFSSLAEAGMVCELLVNNGIRAMLRGASFGALEPLPLPGGYSEIRLMVAHPDFMRAQQLYQAFFTRPLESVEPAADGEPGDE
ncbi:MAG TPA: hypothetical protein VFD58_04675 [Blastocatellia bacterium]|nr:hypothetical protein [Blastocatellia bacterium]